MKTGSGIALAGVLIAASVAGAGMIDSSRDQGIALGRLIASVEAIEKDVKWLKDMYSLSMSPSQLASVEEESGD